MPPLPPLAAAVLVALALGAAATAAAEDCPRGTASGTVTQVHDGATLELGGLPVHQSGVAVPAPDQPGGAAAIEAVRELVRGREVRCELTGEPTAKGCGGTCFAGAADLAAELVRAGLARDCPRYSGGHYADAEQAAAEAGAAIREVYALPGYCRPRRRVPGKKG